MFLIVPWLSQVQGCTAHKFCAWLEEIVINIEETSPLLKQTPSSNQIACFFTSRAGSPCRLTLVLRKPCIALAGRILENIFGN